MYYAENFVIGAVQVSIKYYRNIETIYRRKHNTIFVLSFLKYVIVSRAEHNFYLNANRFHSWMKYPLACF